MRDENGGEDHGARDPIVCECGCAHGWVIKCIDASGLDRWFGVSRDYPDDTPAWYWAPSVGVTIFETFTDAETVRSQLELAKHMVVWCEEIELEPFYAAAKLIESQYE